MENQSIHLYSEGKSYKLYQGNMLDLLDVIEQGSIDAIVTDPPYELNFMNKGWDNSGIAFQKETWEKCLKVLKPGGYLLSFGGSRTSHRIACAIEDAGFEIRDTIMWLYGSGFPKSMNIGLAIDKKNGVESLDTGIASPNARPNSTKDNTLMRHGMVGKDFNIKKAQNEWDGWGTSLKPAYEPIIVARKPYEGNCVDNVLTYGVGGINIDECRVPHSEPVETMHRHTDKGNNTTLHTYGDSETDCIASPNEQGRFPANVILTYDETDYDEVCGGMPDSGSGNNGAPYNYAGREYNNRNSSMFNGDKPQTPSNYNDNGSAARYFYCAKASKRDRDEGLDQFDEKRSSMLASNANINADGEFTGMLAGRTTAYRNTHPTVKPVSLMSYLVRLVTPKGGTVLDPFNGSGSTGKAVAYENFDRDANYKYIGVELSEEYLAISDARIKFVGDQVKQIKLF